MKRPRHPVSIRTALIVLAFALVVPLAGTMGYIVWDQEVRHRHEIGEAMLAEASGLARALELRVATATAALQALSQSEYVDERNFGALYKAAERIVASEDGRLLNIALFAPDGYQILNTQHAYGVTLSNPFKEELVAGITESRLPRTSSRWIREAFTTGKPVVSDLFYGVAARRPLISVHVPVRRDGRVIYVWSCNFSPSALKDMLARQARDRIWLATVVDRSGNIVARYPKHDEFFATPASHALRASIAASTRDFTEGLTLDGIPTYRAHVRTSLGWTVAVSVPRHVLDARSHTAWWAAATIGSIAAAFALVLWFGREVATPLRRLSEAAHGVAEGRLPQLDVRIREFARLRDALAEAAQAKHVETRLALLEGLVRHAPVGIAVFDRDLRFVQLNDRIAALDGLTVDAHIGKTPPEVVGPLGEVIEGYVRQVQDTGEPVYPDEITGEVPTMPGKLRCWIAQFFPLKNALGEVTHVGAVALEITERKEAETAVRCAHAQTRYLVENTPLAVIEWDGDYTVTSWNARAEELFGWSSREVLGRRIDSLPLIYKEDWHKVTEVMRRLYEPHTTYVFSANRNCTKDGRVVRCEWYNSVLHDEQGRIVSIFSLVLDVTQRALTEEKLRDADQRKDLYLATLAHELRNPLAPIRNAVDILRRQASAGAETMWASEVIDRQATQMSRLLDDLLEVSRIARGKLELRTARMTLGDALRDALETSRPALDAGRHHVELEMPDTPVWVQGDHVRLAQVFANLLNNAAKYTNQGGHIRVRVTVEQSHAQVSVKDDGIGIDAKMMERIFQPFSQGDAALHRAQGGLGIGLALVKGLVELHGGAVRACSDGEGKGAEFIVTLPVVPIATIRQPLAAGPDHTLSISTRILVADDNRDAADTLAAVLSSAGATVVVGYDGIAALQLAQSEAPQIAVLDVGMPGLDGYEVAQRLCALPAKPYLIAVTGWGQETDRNNALRAGFDEHLTKPVKPLELLKLIAAFEDGSRAARSNRADSVA